MTENAAAGSIAPAQPAGSPFDTPTGDFPTVKTDIPRTDDELGLDLDDLPSAADVHPGEPVIEKHPLVDSATYSFASIPPAPPAPADSGTLRLRRARPETRRGTQDLGLFGLRLVVGLTFLYDGLQKLAGWFHGPGLSGTREMLVHGGWKHVELSASMLTVSEAGGGILIILGLATPLAAGAVLASITDAWLWKQGMVPGFQYKTVELESILAGLAATLILTGPGRLSFDRNRGWATRPLWGSLTVLVLALIAAAASWLYLHGGNPFNGIVN